MGEDSTYVYFKAESPGLSVFAIIGKRVKPFPWTIVAVVIAKIVIVAIVFSTDAPPKIISDDRMGVAKSEHTGERREP